MLILSRIQSPVSVFSSSCVLMRLEARVPAGFPSPAQDYLDDAIDLSGYLIRNPAATFLMQVQGHSMQGAGILDGDLVIIDKSLKAGNGRIVIACQDGEFTIKRLRQDRRGMWWLCPEHPDFKPIRCMDDCELWGVVVGCVRRF
jgi:DNA polymerase V